MKTAATVLLALAGSLAPFTSFAQQTNTAVAAGGYTPTAETSPSLKLDIAAGHAYCGSDPSTLTSYGGATPKFTFSANTVNYVYLDATSGSCAVSSSTTPFSQGQIPIAIVVTNGTTITSVTDLRGWYAPPPPLVVDAAGLPGSDAAAKINACIKALPSVGGTCDARGLTGNQTLGSDVFAGITATSGTLLFGPGTFTVNTTQNVPPSWRISGAIGGAPPAGLSAGKWGTKFVAGTGITPVFNFNDVFAGKLENFQIDCNSQPGSVGIVYSADGNSPNFDTSQNEFTNFGIYNCQYGFQWGAAVTDTAVGYQMDQTTVRRFRVVSSVSGAEAFTLNGNNAAQAAIFEEGSIQKVNIGFDVKLYGGLAQWKRITFGSLTSQSTPVAVSAASNASPIAITTSSAHGYVTGQRVQIAGVGGNTAANGNWYITVTDSTHFSLNGSTGNGAYTSGGTSTRMASEYSLTSSADYWIEDSQGESGPREGFQNITAATNAAPIQVTVTNHGYSTGDIVNIQGVSGNTAANSMWQITKVDANNFTLNGSAGNGTASFSACTTSGGSAKTVTGATNTSPITITTSAAHGYATGNIVTIASVGGNTNANGTWFITVMSSTTFNLNGSTGNGAYTSGGTSTLTSNGFDRTSGSCVQRMDVRSIDVNGSPYTGGAITLLGNKFDEPVSVARNARITSISNYGSGNGTLLSGASGTRIVSINDRFPNPGAMGGWDSISGGQVLRLGGGDIGADVVSITSPTTITGAGVFSTGSMAAALAVGSGSTWSIDLATGNTQQYNCATGGTSVTMGAPGPTPLVKGEVVTLIFVQAGSGSACTLTWASNFRGHGTVSTTLSSINVQTFIVSNNQTDLYPTGPMQTSTGGSP